MNTPNIDSFSLLEKVRSRQPVVHHLTNWVTIYDCAQIIKTLGASPVMAHAPEEVAAMTGIAASLVLNIGTLTVDLIESMKIAAAAAHKKGIPIVLDVCGAGATSFRDEKVAELSSAVPIDIIKGNASEIARVAGEPVRTKGVDATEIAGDNAAIAQKLATERAATVVMTGVVDIVADRTRVYRVANGHALMEAVVGTGCMAASVIGAFNAVESDRVSASVAGLVCYEVAAEMAALTATGPMLFKQELFDALYALDAHAISERQHLI